MKNLFKSAWPLMLLTALFWTGCSDDDDPVTDSTNPELPSIEIGEPALKQGAATAVFTITPSEETEKWYWKCEEKGKNEATYSKLLGNGAFKIEFPIDYDVNYELTAYAENKTGKSEVAKKEFSFTRTDVLGEMVEFEVKNVSPFSMDVVVKKNAYCARYVVTALKTEVYDETTFIEMAKSSLNPNKEYPIQPYNWSDKSAIFDESTLYRGTMADADIIESEGLRLEQGVKYTVAIYALDTDGEAKVFTEEVNVPVGAINSNVPVELEIDRALRSFTVKATALGAKKLIVNITNPWIPGEDPLYNVPFEDVQPEEVRNYLVKCSADLPHSYTAPIIKTFSDNIEPGNKYTIYAIAIDETGKLGDVVYETVSPADPVYDGIGEITSVEIPEQTDINKLAINIQVDENTKAIRIYHSNVDRKKMIDWIMQDEISGNGVMWREYTVAELPDLADVNKKPLYIMHPGLDYYLYAVTIDKDGKFNGVVNLVTKAGLDGSSYKTKAEEVKEGISLDGVGEASMQVIKNEETFEPGNPSWGTIDSWTYEVEIKVTKGENTNKVYVVFRDDAIFPDNAELPGGFATKEDMVKEEFMEYPELGFNAKLLIDENQTEAVDKFTGLAKYDPEWGGSGRIYVTLDKDGKFKIVDYFICGYTKEQ